MGFVLTSPAGKFIFEIIWKTLFRVAMTQGKQGIWLLIFLDRENTENLVNLIFDTGKLCQQRKNFENFKFFKILLLRWQQGDGAFLS